MYIIFSLFLPNKKNTTADFFEVTLEYTRITQNGGHDSPKIPEKVSYIKHPKKSHWEPLDPKTMKNEGFKMF